MVRFDSEWGLRRKEGYHGVVLFQSEGKVIIDVKRRLPSHQGGYIFLTKKKEATNREARPVWEKKGGPRKKMLKHG